MGYDDCPFSHPLPPHPSPPPTPTPKFALNQQSSSVDYNLDGISDELRITVNMPLQADEVITSVMAVAYTDVRLNVSILLSMGCAAVACRLCERAADIALCNCVESLNLRSPLAIRQMNAPQLPSRV